MSFHPPPRFNTLARPRHGPPARCMGAILSSYRRGLGYALSVAWVLRSRGAFALGLSSLSSPRKATTKGGGQGTWQEEEFICQCYYSKNFFVKKLGRHVDYDGTSEGFDAQHADILKGISASDIKVIHDELAAELHRRKTNFAESRRRKAYIAAHYMPLHRNLYTLRDEFVDSRWRELIGMAREATAEAAAATAVGSAKNILMNKAATAGLLRERPHGVFSFPAMTRHFCRLMREELDHFERSGMPRVPPNTMNKNGVLLYELGMYEGLLDPLLEQFIVPLSSALYASRKHEHTPSASTLDHSRSFTVSYEPDKTFDLAYHYDDSEITLNVNLGGDFEGGELLFGGLHGEPPEAHRSRYPHFHREGMGLMHRGAHCHEAVPVEEGQRVNLIMWCRSTDVRRHGKCAMCGEERKVETAAAH